MKGKYHQTIRETQIDGSDWALNHWTNLRQNYSRAPHFEEASAWLEPLYLGATYDLLSDLNRTLIEAVCRFLKINTVIKNSWDYVLEDGKTERLAGLCAQAGGAEYVSGPAAKDYIEENIFAERGIKLTWFEYGGYQEYPQLWGAFAHNVSILDLIFNCGRNAPKYMKFLSVS